VKGASRWERIPSGGKTPAEEAFHPTIHVTHGPFHLLKRIESADLSFSPPRGQSSKRHIAPPFYLFSVDRVAFLK
jgi:hypothetical protein